MIIQKLTRILTVATLLVFSAASQAGLITFNLTTDLASPSADGFFSGFITFDSGDVTAGNTVMADNFVDWGFTFGSDMAIFASDGTSAFVSGLNSITFDLTANITSWAICVTTPGSGCSTAEFPGFYADSAGNLNYTLTGNGVFQSNVAMSWAPSREVSAPGVAALFSIGVLMLGGYRRRQ